MPFTQPDIHTWIQSVTSVIIASGTIVLVVQLIILLRQLTDRRKWNKMVMAIQQLPSSNELNALEIDLNNSAVKLIDRSTPFSEAEMIAIFSDDNKEIRIKLKNFLNLLECYCTAINFGIIDGDVAKAMYYNKFHRHFIELRPFIDKMRALGSTTYMCELEKVDHEWFPNPTDLSRSCY